MNFSLLPAAQGELDGVVYSQEKTGVIVLAIAHLHRKPGYWSDRLSDD